MYDQLIYGKSSLERIVGIESNDGYAEVFIENEDGSVKTEVIPNKYWILSSVRHDLSWVRLKGDLHYTYGKQFKTREEFLTTKRDLKRADIYSIYNSKEALMVKDGLTYFKNMKHDEASILAFDIEATGLEHNEDSKLLLISNTFRRKGVITRRLFSFSDYKNEGEMILDWCKWVREMNPALIVGHNIFTYDLPYIKFIADKHEVPVCLGRNKKPLYLEPYESKFRKDAAMYYHYHKAHVYGRELIDTMFLAVKYDIGRKYESYGLKYIVKAENKEIPGRVFYDAGQIRHKYHIPEEWEKIKQYSIHDGDDALVVYDLASPAFFYMTQAVPKPYQLILESASGSQINSIMVRSYLQNAHSIPKTSISEDFEGAISFGNPGIYRNVFKVDVASLYPNIMLQYEIYDKYKDPNKHLLQMLSTFTNERLKYKKIAKDTGDKYYDDMQNAFKIFINSVYGFLGAEGLNFNFPEGAALVTKYGREILEKALNWAEGCNCKIVNADTDSISFSLATQDVIPPELQLSLLKDLNSLYPEKIRFENDGFYPSIIVVKAKNYIMWDGKKLKYKGSAIKATTKEIALQQFIKDVIQTIIDGKDNFLEVYHRYVKEILNVKDIKRWATRKTITDKVLNGERTNEVKVKDAIEDTEYVEGDRAYFYFKSDNTLSLIERFEGDYNIDRLLHKLFTTALIFDTILPIKELLPNYKLKRNKDALSKIQAA